MQDIRRKTCNLKLVPKANFSKYFTLYITCIFTRQLTAGMVFFVHFPELLDTIMGI
jgi:hypothetical protein